MHVDRPQESKAVLQNAIDLDWGFALAWGLAAPEKRPANGGNPRRGAGRAT
jgi:hypothetical protein